MITLSRKYQVHVSPYRGWRISINEHAIHGNILAAGNHVISGMDKIHSEINRVALDNPSVV